MSKSKVIVFLCSEYFGVEDLIIDLSNTIIDTNLKLIVVTDSKEASDLIKSSTEVANTKNISFFDNYFNDLEKLSKLEEEVKQIEDNIKNNTSYFNLFSVDYDRFQSLNLNYASESNLKEQMYIFIKMFLYLHKKYDVCLSFSEGPHNFFLRSYDAFLENCSIDTGKYIYIRPGRVGNSIYLQDSASRESITIKNSIKKELISISPSYMNKTSPLMRGFLWKLSNIKKTSIYRNIKKILITKGFKLATFDKPNILSLLTMLYLREIKSSLISLTRGVSKYVSNKFPNGNLAIYPEHYHPEASTSAYDFNLCNDYENVIRIRKALPESLSLIYKLHPSNKNRHPSGMIKKLSRIPGVYVTDTIVDIESRSSDLILISVSSTMILDFVEKNIPVLIIGSPEFTKIKNIASRVVEVSIDELDKNSIKYLEEARKKILNNQTNFRRNELIGNLYTLKEDLKEVIHELIL